MGSVRIVLVLPQLPSLARASLALSFSSHQSSTKCDVIIEMFVLEIPKRDPVPMRSIDLSIPTPCLCRDPHISSP